MTLNKYQINIQELLEKLEITWHSFVYITLIGFLLTFIFKIWILLLVSAIICGLFTPYHSRGVISGSLSVFLVYTAYTSFNIVYNDFMATVNTFLDVSGNNLSIFYVLFFIDIFSLTVGAIGGYFGSTIRNYVDSYLLQE